MWWKDKLKGGLTPVGTHRAILVDAKLDETGDHAKISCTFEIDEPAADYNKDSVFINFTFKETTAKFLSWQLGVIGVWQQLSECGSEEDAARKSAELIFGMIDKLTVELKVEHREYNGKTYVNAIIGEVLSGGLDGNDHASDSANQLGLGIDQSEQIPF